MMDWHSIKAPIPSTAAYQRDVDDGHLSVFVGEEAPGWHLSMSHRSNLVGLDGHHLPGRYPTWDEVVEARYRFCPKDVTMAMLLPPPEEYVNVHATTFHLWQVPDDVPTH